MCANVDSACAFAVDAIIDDLPQRERLAVYNEWLATVFRFEGNAQELYDAAKAAIERGLAKRGMW
jgi:regulator of sirC expression with transglutaminase-like and TPR domain